MSTSSRPGASGADGRQPETSRPEGSAGTARAAGSDGERESSTPNAREGASPAGRPTAPPWQRGSTNAGGSGAARPSGGVDAPTTQMNRPELPSDMPDLSAVPRTSGRQAGQPSGAAQASNAGGTGSVRTANDRRSGAAGAERSTTAAAQGNRRGPRRASLQLKHLDPWSVLKLSLVLSFALFLVWMVAVGVLYLVLDGMGVWERLNTTFTDFVSVNDPNAHSAPLIGPGRVFGVAAIVGAVNIVLMTALATISSFIYNLTSDLVGGVEVTLTERD